MGAPSQRGDGKSTSLGESFSDADTITITRCGKDPKFYKFSGPYESDGIKVDSIDFNVTCSNTVHCHSGSHCEIWSCL